MLKEREERRKERRELMMERGEKEKRREIQAGMRGTSLRAEEKRRKLVG